MTRLYTIARALLANPKTQAALSVALVGYGAGKLIDLARQQEQELRALESDIVDRRLTQARLGLDLARLRSELARHGDFVELAAEVPGADQHEEPEPAKG